MDSARSRCGQSGPEESHESSLASRASPPECQRIVAAPSPKRPKRTTNKPTNLGEKKQKKDAFLSNLVDGLRRILPSILPAILAIVRHRFERAAKRKKEWPAGGNEWNNKKNPKKNQKRKTLAAKGKPTPRPPPSQIRRPTQNKKNPTHLE